MRRLVFVKLLLFAGLLCSLLGCGGQEAEEPATAQTTPPFAPASPVGNPTVNPQSCCSDHGGVAMEPRCMGGNGQCGDGT